MSSKAQAPEGILFADFGELFYHWHKKDPAGLIYEQESRECEMELERLIELIDYVVKKKAASQ